MVIFRPDNHLIFIFISHKTIVSIIVQSTLQTLALHILGTVEFLYKPTHSRVPQYLELHIFLIFYPIPDRVFGLFLSIQITI